MINFNGRKVKALAALYNNSKPLGKGFLHFTPEDMDEVQAQNLLNSGQTYIDYYKGRVIKVDFRGDSFDPALYDRDNGEGSAAEALEDTK